MVDPTDPQPEAFGSKVDSKPPMYYVNDDLDDTGVNDCTRFGVKAAPGLTAFAELTWEERKQLIPTFASLFTGLEPTKLDCWAFTNELKTMASRDIPTGKTLEGNQPQYASCRSLLRSGPAASLRVNIRAVAQYASESGKGKAATDDVDQCLRALEDLDSLLLRASRNDRQASVELMKAKIFVALGALDSLLETVPPTVLDKGRAIADAYRLTEDVEPEKLDPEMQQLQSIL